MSQMQHRLAELASTSDHNGYDEGEGFTPGKPHITEYYKITLNDLDGNRFTTDMTEILRPMEFIPGCIIKYAYRAGNKRGVPARSDIIKILEYASRWLQECGEKELEL